MDKFSIKINQLSNLSTACWQEFRTKLYYKTLEKEAFFSKEDSMTTEIGFINAGLMRMFFLDKHGEEWNKTFLTDGDFVMANVNPAERSKVFIQAMEKTQLIGIQLHDFKRLIQKYPELSTLSQKLTANYLAIKQRREIELLSMQAKDRYINFLEEFAAIKDKISQYHTSRYLGITPTQLSRIRKKLKGINICK